MTREDLLADLLRRAAARGLALARLDGAGHPAAPLDGADADLLAEWRPWPTWRALVGKAADDAGWRVVMIVPRGGVLTLYLVDPAAGPLSAPGSLQIDLHRALSARGIPFADPGAAFARAAWVDGARRLDPDDVASLRGLQHRLVHGRPRREGERIDPRWSRAALGCPALLGLPAPLPWLAAAATALLRRPVATLRLAVAKSVDRAARWWRPPGTLWAISGPDGAGKSLLIESLRRSVPRRLADDARIFHTRPFLLPRLAGLRALPPGHTASRPPTDDSGLPAGPWRSAARWLIAAADYRLGGWLLVRPQLAAGRLVIFDRYTMDYRVAPGRRGIAATDAAMAWLERFAPPAGGTVVLTAPPGELVRRKGEETEAEAARQVAAYRRLASATPNGLLLDSGALAPEAIAARTHIHITEVMARHARFDRS